MTHGRRYSKECHSEERMPASRTRRALGCFSCLARVARRPQPLARRGCPRRCCRRRRGRPCQKPPRQLRLYGAAPPARTAGTRASQIQLWGGRHHHRRPQSRSRRTTEPQALQITTTWNRNLQALCLRWWLHTPFHHTWNATATTGPQLPRTPGQQPLARRQPPLAKHTRTMWQQALARWQRRLPKHSSPTGQPPLARLPRSLSEQTSSDLATGSRRLTGVGSGTDASWRVCPPTSSSGSTGLITVTVVASRG